MILPARHGAPVRGLKFLASLQSPDSYIERYGQEKTGNTGLAEMLLIERARGQVARPAWYPPAVKKLQ
jgi:hypothetical protein